MKTGTYEIRHGHAIRTAKADYLKQRREVKKEALNERPMSVTAQDIADEKNLSHSKTYPTKPQIPGSVRRRMAKGV